MENTIERLLTDYAQLKVVCDDIEKAVLMIEESIRNGGKVLLCGNGGSAADCEHIMGELLKEFKIKRGINEKNIEKFEKLSVSKDEYQNYCEGIPAISLVNSVAYSTAFINDMNADYLFGQQVYVIGQHGDILFAISTSGNSRNVVHAVKVAKVKGMKVIGLTGESGGQMKQYCDVCISVPSNDTARIQEMHMPIYHTICEKLELDLVNQSIQWDE